MNYNGFEKIDWIIYCIIVAILLAVSILFGGCSSTRVTTDPGNIRGTNAYWAGRLEESISEFDRGTRAAVEKSRSITDTVERVDKIFREYEQTALRLRDEVDTLRREMQNVEKGSNNTVINNSSTYNSGDSPNSVVFKRD